MDIVFADAIASRDIGVLAREGLLDNATER
jgi:hypothetical protein